MQAIYLGRANGALDINNHNAQILKAIPAFESAYVHFAVRFTRATCCSLQNAVAE